MTKRLIDPSHLFNLRGEPILTIEHLTQQLAAKEKEIEKLRTIIRHQAKRQQEQHAGH